MNSLDSILLINSLIVFIFFLMWGSFLNVLGLRLVQGKDVILARSTCPHCAHTLAWYDLIPLLSWLSLCARCRYCNASISALYPFFELLTAFSCSTLFILFGLRQAIAYTFLVSALIVSSRSDIEMKLISRLTSLYLVPVGIICAWLQWIPLSVLESVMGAFIGFGIPYAILWTYRYLYGIDGLGIGDCDLLALIGSFLGTRGAWTSLVVAAIMATIVSMPLLLAGRISRKTTIPFGPFIALGAYLTIVAAPWIIPLILPV